MVLANSFTDGVSQAFEDVAVFLPKVAAFVAILIVGYIIAKIIAGIVRRALQAARVDRVVERGGLDRVMGSMTASVLLSKVVFYALLLITLQLSFNALGDNPVSGLLTSVIAFLPKLLVALVIIVVAALIASAVRGVVTSALGGLSYGPTLARVAAGAVLAIGVFAALNQVEVAPEIVNGLFYGALAIIVGSAIVAIGGGGIAPMQERWKRALTTLDAEQPKIRAQMQARGERREIVLDEPIEQRTDMG